MFWYCLSENVTVLTCFEFPYSGILVLLFLEIETIKVNFPNKEIGKELIKKTSRGMTSGENKTT